MDDSLHFDQLLINGELFPAVYFHLPSEPYGFLSNWYLADFVIDGTHFSSNEQYIMYRKCVLLGDNTRAQMVMQTNSPESQQSLASDAGTWNATLWYGMRQVIAMRGLYAKFSQNEGLKKQLLDTDDAYLVECAYKDINWACGWHLYDNGRQDINKWRGKNILGFSLMEVRKQLRSEKNEANPGISNYGGI